MTAETKVLIISTSVDVATDDVVGQLAEQGVSVLRVNTEDLPFERMLSIDYSSGQAQLVFDGVAVQPQSIWYRRIRTSSKPDSMDEGIYDFCLRENRAALLGGLLTQNVRWMSHPAAVWRAEFKPYQLQVARAVGLTIPKTLISNDPAAVARFYHAVGRMAIKPARSGHFWQGGEEFSVYTSEVLEDDLRAIDDARWTPSIYQELVPKDVDIRVTFVGGRFFSATIHSQTDPDASVDWRKTSNPHIPHSTVVYRRSWKCGLAHSWGRLTCSLDASI